MEVINKKTSKAFGKNVYLLGQDQDGINYWLEEPTFDCGWYWGLAYIESYTHNTRPDLAKDINSHEHFDSKFLDGKGYVDGYQNFFKKSVLDRHSIYRLFELMECAYTLSKMAGICEKGSAWVSKNDCYDTLKDQGWYLEIIQKKLPAVISEICNLLGGKTKPEQFEKQAIYKE